MSYYNGRTPEQIKALKQKHKNKDIAEEKRIKNIVTAVTSKHSINRRDIRGRRDHEKGKLNKNKDGFDIYKNKRRDQAKRKQKKRLKEKENGEEPDEDSDFDRKQITEMAERTEKYFETFKLNNKKYSKSRKKLKTLDESTINTPHL